MKSRADQFLTSFLRSAMLLCIGTAALSVQAATINFELLPDSSAPVDDLHLPINYVFQDGRTGLSFGFDTDGDNIADTEAVIEEHGNTDDVFSDGNVCVGYTAQNGSPRDHDLTLDGDGDGYGDNQEGENADQCPTENGTSYIDFLGCLDDGDGYRDLFEPTGLAGNPTQWEDYDRDGYGDNASGTNPDLCPETEAAYKTLVDQNGCDPTQSDADGDGVADYFDNCPDEPSGAGGYDDGCPGAVASDDDTSSELLGLSPVNAALAGVSALIGVVVLLVVIRRLFRSDEFDYDDDEDEDEVNPLSQVNHFKENEFGQIELDENDVDELFSYNDGTRRRFTGLIYYDALIPMTDDKEYDKKVAMGILEFERKRLTNGETYLSDEESVFFRDKLY